MGDSSSLRVLIAEDDAAIHEEVRTMIASLGHTVVGSVYNGPDAVALADQLKPDVVLIDLVMPDPVTGHEDRQAGLRATESILSQSPAPVIWLTAHESPALIAQASRLGVSAYLVKPPRSSEMARALVIAHARFTDLQELRRLNAALQSEIAQRQRAEEGLRERNIELEAALTQVKTLTGLLPICCNCKKIRDDRGYWNQVEVYLSQHADVRFSHGICPACIEKLYPGLMDDPPQEPHS